MPEISERQLAANRANARKSTGPRSPAGKAASSHNALKSGIYAKAMIIDGEDPADLEALRDGYYRDFAPATTDERVLLDRVIEMAWRVRRLDTLYNQNWIWAVENDRDSPYQKPPTRLFRPFNGNSEHFAKIRREYTTYDRAFHRARTELIKARKARRQPEMASFRQNPEPENGFVPANPQPVPPRPLLCPNTEAVPSSSSPISPSSSAPPRPNPASKPRAAPFLRQIPHPTPSPSP